MTIIHFFKLYLVTVPVFFIIDLLWLGVVARSVYREQLGFILSPKVNWAAAVVFYLIYIAGIIFFAVRPAYNTCSWSQAAYLGALFGFFTYATYDLTNLATIDNWPIKIVAIDIAWGVFLCTVVALISYLIAGKLV